MRGINRVIVAGNLTRDPDVRATVNKNSYARFGVAVNSVRRNANGEFQETTEYVNIVVWGSQAENCGKFLKKGSPILIEGRLSTSTYEARDGSGKRTSTEVVAESVSFLGSGQQNSGGNYQRSNSNSNYPRQSTSTQQNNNRGGNYNQPPADSAFGQSIGENGFGDFSVEENSDIPF